MAQGDIKVLIENASGGYDEHILKSNNIVFKRSATKPSKPSNSLKHIPLGWSNNIEIASINGSSVASAISAAIADSGSTEATLFITAEAISGRSLADVYPEATGDTVNSTDAFYYNRHISDIDSNFYIHDIMHPYMVINKSTYSAYFDTTNPVWACVGFQYNSEWVWDEPYLIRETSVSIDDNSPDASIESIWFQPTTGRLAISVDDQWVEINNVINTSSIHGNELHSSNYISTETDPVVGAINGLVKANGAGTISAATAGSDYGYIIYGTSETPPSASGYNNGSVYFQYEV